MFSTSLFGCRKYWFFIFTSAWRANQQKEIQKEQWKTKTQKVQKCGKGIFESQNIVKLQVQNTTLGIIVSSTRCKTKSIFANICYMHNQKSRPPLPGRDENFPDKTEYSIFKYNLFRYYLENFVLWNPLHKMLGQFSQKMVLYGIL